MRNMEKKKKQGLKRQNCLQTRYTLKKMFAEKSDELLIILVSKLK